MLYFVPQSTVLSSSHPILTLFDALPREENWYGEFFMWEVWWWHGCFNILERSMYEYLFILDRIWCSLCFFDFIVFVEFNSNPEVNWPFSYEALPPCRQSQALFFRFLLSHLRQTFWLSFKISRFGWSFWFWGYWHLQLCLCWFGWYNRLRS